MSIIHLYHDDDPFARIPRKTAQSIGLGSDALAVLTYLFSHAPGWDPYDGDIQRRFGWGRDRMRTVWKNLEGEGFARRNHRVRVAGGHLKTVTDVSPHPIFTGGGSTDGGSTTGGGAGGGSPTTNEKKKKKEGKQKKYLKNQPAEGGKRGAPASRDRLLFELVFGVEYLPSLEQHINESRAVEIAKIHRLNTDQVRRVLGEFLTEIHNTGGEFRKGAENAFHHLCRAANGTGRAPLAHTSTGDANLPGFT